MPEAQGIQIPWTSPGVLDLGPMNGGAIKRLANYASSVINSGQPIPESPFVEWAADRVTGEDKQDLVFFLQGRRGSGKSYSFLYLGKRLAEAIAKRKGGTWQDYFSLDFCATLEDTDKVLRILNSADKFRVVLIDDASIAISNRSWNSPQNRNFNALLSVCRTNRWILLLTAPLRSHIDNQVREMCDLSGTVYKSFHKNGFNILKVTSSEIGFKNKEYTKKLHFGGKKIDFWVTFSPDIGLAREYDIQRAEGTKRINQSIVENGSFRSKGNSPKDQSTLKERNLQSLIEKHGENIRKAIAENPDISQNGLASRFCVSPIQAQMIIERMGLKTGAKAGRPRKVFKTRKEV